MVLQVSTVRYLLFACLIALTGMPTRAYAEGDYYRHVLFDNSLAPGTYYYSGGKAVYPSTLESYSGKLPVETKTFYSPPSAIRLAWRSVAGGSWEGEIRVVSIRNRIVDFDGDTLYL